MVQDDAIVVRMPMTLMATLMINLAFTTARILGNGEEGSRWSKGGGWRRAGVSRETGGDTLPRFPTPLLPHHAVTPSLDSLSPTTSPRGDTPPRLLNPLLPHHMESLLCSCGDCAGGASLQLARFA
ncbi:hypothetical protein GWK47_028228 [Chionoecetes opilio]|uniref:Uncharacterized protein n=1 Tax=Chionoecetes opilio TaxID=41210 RepID=A0A8J5CS50_CHIOP|nr:hypothetical protein GWK47_028228 [Chionoecetes opilio]